MSIPVLGVPILNRPDLLKKMLASIDYPVNRVVVIDNGAVVSDDVANVHRPGRNLGVAASWNYIITSNPDAPWWCIVNSDLEFAPGDLERLATHMETQGGFAFLLTPSAFGITKEVVEKVGLFDENFHPAYYEDNDYVYRCGLLDVTCTALPAHYAHERSSTIYSDMTYLQENGRTFPENTMYYMHKWGGIPLQEAFKTPFNRGGSPREWTLDPDRIARLTWKKE